MRDLRSSPSPWAARLRSLVRHPVRSFQQSIDEDVPGRVAVPILLMGILTACTGFFTRSHGGMVLVIDETGLSCRSVSEPFPMERLFLLPFLPVLLFAGFGFASVPVHLVARRVFAGRGRWWDTVQALTWAGLPTLGLLPVSLAVDSSGLGRAATATALLIALSSLILGGSLFLGAAHGMSLRASFVSIGAGVLVLTWPALWIDLAAPQWRWESVGVTLLLLAGAVSLAGLVLGALVVWLQCLRKRS